MPTTIKYYRDDIYERVIKKIKEIKKGRNPIYGDNWALMGLKSLLAAAYYKCDRAVYTEDLDKKLDDVLDALNYLVFAANRLLDMKEGVKPNED